MRHSPTSRRSRAHVFTSTPAKSRLISANPATAVTWDFSWVSSILFPGVPGVVEPAEGNAGGRNAATITPVTDGGPGPDRILSVGFEIGRIDVFDVAASSGLEAAGVSIPVFDPPRSSPDGAPVPGFADPGLASFADFGLGSYEWTGPRDRPDTFRVTLIAPGSGPDPHRSFSGVGVRRAETSEPVLLVLVALALAVAARARRAARSS